MSALGEDCAGNNQISASTSSTENSSSTIDSSPSQAERARVLELARYFSAAHVVPVNFNVPPEPQEHAPRFTTDSTLTALAQLGVFKLECDRSFISLIDGTHQYIIGEATRTTSLCHDSSPIARDGLYLGFRVLELDFGVCPQTIQVFTSQGMKLDTANISADQTHYVIRDFRADPNYSSRPYVTGFPHMRSYAEVPLTSPSGFVIGSYCVVDTKPRTFDGEAIATLGGVASTIMDHLELLKGRLDLDRANKLVRGLGSYVDGYSGLQEQQTMSLSAMSTSQNVTLHRRQGNHSPPVLGHETSDSTQTSSSASVTPTSHDLTSALSAIETATESFGLQDPLSSRSEDNEMLVEGKNDVSRDIRATLTRAGNLIRQAMNLHGVIFLDAYAQGFRSRTRSYVRSTAQSQRSPSQSATRSCTLLGHSVNGENNPGDALVTTELLDIGEDWLHRVLASFPNGNIFSYDAMGVVHRTHPNTNDGHMLHPSRQSLGAPRLVEISADDHYEIAAEISRAIKDARSVFILPLWNFQKDQWFAVAMGWTTDPARILDSGDLNYISAFGNSVMVEVSRLEALAVTQAKSDFISSISHELRSPLHGVLAATELLRESAQSVSQRGMLDSIDVCGNMLLDTMNHLLDYAKISKIIQRKHLDLEDKSSQPPRDDALSLSVVDLGQLVQDVVEGVHLGSSVLPAPGDVSFGQVENHILSGKGETSLDGHPSHASSEVLVLVDIEPSVNWHFETEVGAWKRIVMNLCGNSLKYTDHGLISVKLFRTSQTLDSDEGSEVVQQICLQVNDTGHGISPEYLKHHLFTPFAQENGLSAGTGLGLSIVHQLVNSLEGHIEVQSEKDAGTQISVVIPLGSRTRERSAQTESDHERAHLSLDQKNRLQGHKIYLAPVNEGGNIDSASAHDEIKSASALDTATAARHLLAKIAEQWFGMSVVSVPEPIEEASIGSDTVFVLSPAQSSAAHNGCTWTLKSHGHPPDMSEEHVIVSQPLMPKRLAACFSHILNPIKTKLAVTQPSRKSRLDSSETIDESRPRPSLHDSELQPASPPLPQPEQSSDALENPRPLNLLIVDDSPINLKVLAACLNRVECTYTECLNGQKAVEAYQSGPITFDLVFMDLSMPIMDGFAATRAIRAHESAFNLPRTRIVALTALGSKDAQAKAYASGMDMFLSKPVRMADVRKLVNELRIDRNAAPVGGETPHESSKVAASSVDEQKS